MEAEDCRYLKGPVSWKWLSKAASLPGKALHLAVALCVMSGIRRSKEVTVPTKLLEELWRTIGSSAVLSAMSILGSASGQTMNPTTVMAISAITHGSQGRCGVRFACADCEERGLRFPFCDGL